jgi:L-ascorbate metabolism protein UlaG (beta-lactamase superfamily)
LTRSIASNFGPTRAVPDKITRPVRSDARLAVLWVGHATMLIQIDDKIILTDPVFTSSVGQVSKRLVEPGIDPESLPAIDAVLISHLHFDHLSLGSLDLLQSKIRELYIPRGGVVYLPPYSFPVRELSTWESASQGSDPLTVTSVPVKHLGWRYVLDAWMDTQFTGYVISYHGMTVYFGGDTAYDKPLFDKTARRFPSIDLALLPIAPIEPRAHTRPRHVDPSEAVQMFLDLGARRMVPMHFDTFVNGNDEPGDAGRALRSVMKQRGLGADRITILEIGQQTTIDVAR